jgi:hypothetical protein
MVSDKCGVFRNSCAHKVLYQYGKNVKNSNCYIPYTITTIIPRNLPNSIILEPRFCFPGTFLDDTANVLQKMPGTDIFIRNIFTSILYEYASLEVCHSY